MARPTFSTLVVEGHRFEAILAAGGPRLEVSNGRMVLGSVPLGASTLIHTARGGATLADALAGAGSARMPRLTTQGAKALGDRFGLGADVSAAAFKCSPAWSELKAFVAAHPRVAARFAGSDERLPGWHGEATREVSPIVPPYLPLPTAAGPWTRLDPLLDIMSGHSRECVSPDGMSRVLPSMDASSWIDLCERLDLIERDSLGSGFRFMEDFVPGLRDDAKAVAVEVAVDKWGDLETEARNFHPLLVGIKMRFTGEPATLTVEFDFLGNDDAIGFDNTYQFATAATCQQVLAEVENLCASHGLGRLELRVAPAAYESTYGIASHLLSHLGECIQRQRLSVDGMAGVDVVVGRAFRDGTPSDTCDSPSIEVPDGAKPEVMMAYRAATDLALALGNHLVIHPSRQDEMVESYPGEGTPSRAGRTFDERLAVMESVSMRAAAIELLGMAGMGKGDTLVVGRRYAAALPGDLAENETWGTDGVHSAILIHPPGSTDGEKASRLAEFWLDWDDKLSSVHAHPASPHHEAHSGQWARSVPTP